MTKDQHVVLLDSLEAAGFSRNALEGAGNALHFNYDWGTLDFYEDDKKQLMLHMVMRSGTVRLTFPPAAARQIGAFMLAWGAK